MTPEGGGRQSDHEAPKKRAVLGQIRSFLNVRFCLNTAHSFTPKVELKFLPYLNLAYWQHYLSGLRTIQGQGRV